MADNPSAIGVGANEDVSSSFVVGNDIASAPPGDLVACPASPALSFLTTLYPEANSGFLSICHSDTAFKSDHFDLRNPSALGDAAERAIELGASHNTYFGVGLLGEKPAGGSRGKGKGVIALPGLFADVDFGSTGHKATALPPTLAAAMELIAAVGLPPSMNVYTGYGVHVYWLFKELLHITDVTVRARVKDLMALAFRALTTIAAQRACKLDPVTGVCACTSRPWDAEPQGPRRPEAGDVHGSGASLHGRRPWPRTSRESFSA